jgi:HKD family nuclease
MEGGTRKVTYTTAISAHIRRPEGIQRLGQALWMMVGERLDSSAELLWAGALLGPGGDRLLWKALLEFGCIAPSQGNQLLARPLAAFLCTLWEAAAEAEVSLMWTLPAGLSVPGVAATGYADGVRELSRNTEKRLILLAPYVEEKGIGQLQEELLDALARGVSVVLVAQDANVLGSWTSDSLELLRREARGLSGVLNVYTAPITAPVLLHSKLVVSDGRIAIVGSADLTGNALLRNLETGVLVGARQAAEIERVVQRAIELGFVRLVFSTERLNGH